MSLLDRLKESFPLSPLYELASYKLMMKAAFSAARNSRARVVRVVLFGITRARRVSSRSRVGSWLRNTDTYQQVMSIT